MIDDNHNKKNSNKKTPTNKKIITKKDNSKLKILITQTGLEPISCGFQIYVQVWVQILVPKSEMRDESEYYIIQPQPIKLSFSRYHSKILNSIT